MTKAWLKEFRKRYCEYNDWNIGVVELSPAALQRLIFNGELGRVRWCPRLSTLHSRADPFVWAQDGEPRIIFEEIDQYQLQKRGRIKSLGFDELLQARKSRGEIDLPVHLSYPFTFNFNDKWYCVPECARRNALELFAWNPDGRTWKLESCLMEGIGVLDPTLYRHRGIWYLFGTVRGDGPRDKLRIWWSNDLEGPWQMHANNPAKIDARSARSAGPVFEHSGVMYRPAQDCSEGYGGAVSINRIDVLTPEQFSEVTVSRIAPDPEGPYPDGLHTLTVFRDRLLIDGKKTRTSAVLPIVKLARRLFGSGRR